MNSEKDASPAISYWSKDKVTCPVCKNSFPREIMLSGRGRMIAGNLSDDLHRSFEKSAKYGNIYPLIYEIGVCPQCYTALSWKDFVALKNKEVIEKLEATGEERKKQVEVIFPHFSMEGFRTLYDACGIYYLAILTYELVNKELTPTIKKAILTLRTAWLTADLNKVYPGHNFDYISQSFYHKALFFYNESIVKELDNSERSSEAAYFGPDMDKNYGWDGVIYLRGLLEYKYGQTEDMQVRLKSLSEAKTSIARMFGLGKSSKSKPGPLLENARELYETLGKELKETDI